jgi:hypothetical protein
MPARYRSNTPRFVDETIDGEALIMDMLKGNYFSCLGASAIAWDALKQGVSVDETAEALAGAYGLAATDVAPDVDRFARRLVDEEMLVEVETVTVAPAEAASGAVAAATSGGRSPLGDYRALTYERFSDLADLILLDPVHDVTEAGWPKPKS